MARIVGLPREDMTEIKFHGTQIAHSYFQVLFDWIHVLLSIRLCPAYHNCVVANVTLVAPFDHFFGDSQRDSLLPRMRRAAGSENQLADLARIIQRDELRDSAAHGMTAHDGAFEPKMV